MSNVIPPLAAPFVKAAEPTDGQRCGVVVKIDGTYVTLDDGRTYSAGPGADLTKLQIGARVVVMNPDSLQGSDIVPVG